MKETLPPPLLSDEEEAQIQALTYPKFESAVAEDEDQTNALRQPKVRPPVVAEPEAEDEKPPMLTLEQLEEIHEQAREEGYAEGFAQGQQQGLEEGKLKGLQQGHAEGVSQGFAQGLADGQAHIDEQVARLHQLIERLAAPVNAVELQLEAQLVQLCQDLTEAVIQHEMHTQPQVLLTSIQRSLQALPINEQRIVLRLHPQDIELIGDHSLADERCQLQADASVHRGDVRISSGPSSIDWRLKERVQQVFEQLIAGNDIPSAQSPFLLDDETAAPVANLETVLAEPAQVAASDEPVIADVIDSPDDSERREQQPAVDHEPN